MPLRSSLRSPIPALKDPPSKEPDIMGRTLPPKPALILGSNFPSYPTEIHGKKPAMGQQVHVQNLISPAREMPQPQNNKHVV